MNLQDLAKDVECIARDAGAEIMKIYERGEVETWSKDDKSPLTEADLAAHHLICDRLAASTPTIPVLSEESKGIDAAERQTWSQYWLVDPLDGTKEFLKRNGEFTVTDRTYVPGFWNLEPLVAVDEHGDPQGEITLTPDTHLTLMDEEGRRRWYTFTAVDGCTAPRSDMISRSAESARGRRPRSASPRRRAERRPTRRPSARERRQRSERRQRDADRRYLFLSSGFAAPCPRAKRT